MNKYYAYGLNILSDIDIPLLKRSKMGETDVSVKKGDVKKINSEKEHHIATLGSEDAVLLRWDSVGGFLVENGNTITVDPNPGTDPYLLSLPLLGPVMAALLSQRGLLVLHGSAVANDQEAVVFLGPSGSGKSSAAAAMHARGYQLVTDDVLAVDLRRDSQPVVAPGLPLLKLRPNVADNLLGDKTNNIFPNIDNYGKVIHSDNSSAIKSWKEINAVNILNIGEEHKISKIKDKKSFLKISDSIYSNKFAESKDTRKENFKKCLTVSEESTFYDVKRTRDINRAEDLFDIVEEKAGI